MTGDDFVIYEDDMRAIEAELARFLEQAEATCALLVHRSGQLVAQRGFTRRVDTTSLAALAAGAFASTMEVARLLGEAEFSAMFQEGEQAHIHLSTVGDHAILVAVFDQRTTIGMVRLCAADAGARLDRVFTAAAGRSPEQVGAVIEEPGADLFREESPPA